MTERKKPIGFAYGNKAAWMTQRYKLMTKRGRKPQLFDLLADPQEQNDLAAEHPELVASMLKSLQQWVVSCNESCGTRFRHLKIPQ